MAVLFLLLSIMANALGNIVSVLLARWVDGRNMITLMLVWALLPAGVCNCTRITATTGSSLGYV